MRTILRKYYDEVTCNEKEILRYAGIFRKYSKKIDFDSREKRDLSGGDVMELDFEKDALLLETLHACEKEQEGHDDFKVCYREFPIFFKEDTENDEVEIDLGFTKTTSKDLYKNLRGCEKIILFSATIGLSIDRFIEKYNRLSPVKAMFHQAIGTEKVEALCNKFNEEMKEKYLKEGYEMRPRYSPGYGDCPLSMQLDVFKALDCPRQIGISLNSSLIMTPSKSVTAIIGLKKN